MEEKSKKDTEEELRKKLKEELRAELLEELKEEKKNSSSNKEEKTQSAASTLKHPANDSSSKVHFESYNSSEVETVNDMNRKERDLKKQKKLEENSVPTEKKKNSKPTEEGEKSQGSLITMIIALIIIAGMIFFFPNIYKFLSQRTTKPDEIIPSKSNSNEKTVYETITVNSEVLNSFTYPIMRNSLYDKTSYYQKDSLTMSDFSNNDILYNAFIYVYSGSIAPYDGIYTGEYCGNATTKKMLNPKYIEARIENLFSRSTKYIHATFTVPSTNTSTPYVGTWVYDKESAMYIYYGDCNPITPSSIVYYDLKQIYDANGTSNNTVIDVSYYMGFAEVNTTNKQYTIYSDAAMTNVLTTGTLTTNEYEQELEVAFNEYLQNNHAAKSYKYTFSSNNCSYQDYCFEKGEWIK